MREPHRIGAHFLDETDVLLMLGGSQRVAHVLPVLMTGHALDLEVPAVEEKALVRVEGDRAETRLDAHAVSARYLRREGVKIGVVHIPKAGRGHGESRFPALRSHGGGGDGIPLRVRERKGDFVTGEGADRHEGHFRQPAVLLLCGSHEDAAAVEGDIEMLFGEGEELHTPVKPAVKSEVRHGGVDALVGRVVGVDLEEILLSDELARQRHEDGGVAALMHRQRLAVETDGGLGVRRAYLETARRLFRGELLRVGPARPEIPVLAALTVEGVPSVGEIDAQSFAVDVELPTAVKIYAFHAHLARCDVKKIIS